jgi:hypothetical protein
MVDKGELIGSIFCYGGGQVTLAWCPAGRVELRDYATVDEAKQWADSRAVKVRWEQSTPGEWLAWEEAS